MSEQHLSIFGFADDSNAKKIYKVMKKREGDSPLAGIVDVEDLVLITRGRTGKVKIDSSAEDETQDGLGKKALIGILVPGPVGLGVAVNVLRGKRKAKQAGDVGASDDLLTVIGEQVPEGGAAIVVLTSVTPPREKLAAVAADLGAQLDIDQITTEEQS